MDLRTQEVLAAWARNLDRMSLKTGPKAGLAICPVLNNTETSPFVRQLLIQLEVSRIQIKTTEVVPDLLWCVHAWTPD